MVLNHNANLNVIYSHCNAQAVIQNVPMNLSQVKKFVVALLYYYY